MLSFLGGIHPYDGKNLSKDEHIKEFFPEGEIVIPVSQHIGAPAVPIVQKGDEVMVGDLIAKAGGYVSANIHSSVSGTVKGIEKRMLLSGVKGDCIIIDNDKQFSKRQEYTKEDVSGLSSDEIKNRIQDAGIVGMGGAGFPTHVKLSPKKPDKIDYIIVNGAECEPYLTSDYRRMLESPDEIIEGLNIMMKLFDNCKGVIAVEDNKSDAIKLLKEKIKAYENISVATLKTKYPQGAERMLVYAVTGRKLNSSMLPADKGCIVDNIDTVHAIYRAVCYKEPLTRRIVTLTGDGIAAPCNYSVPIGTNHRELIERNGGFNGEPEKIISGGPMMGVAMHTLDVPIVKN